MGRNTIYKPQEVRATEKMLRKKGLLNDRHIQKVNAFVQQAEAVADAKIEKLLKKGKPTHIGMENPSSGQRWKYCLRTEFYCAEMNRLTIEAGLRCE